MLQALFIAIIDLSAGKVFAFVVSIFYVDNSVIAEIFSATSPFMAFALSEAF